MNDKETIDTILDYFRQSIEDKLPLRPVDWLDSSAKLVILSQELDEELADLKGGMADIMAEYIKTGMPVTQAKAIANSGELYRKYLKLEAKKERIIAHYQIAKKRVELNEF